MSRLITLAFTICLIPLSCIATVWIESDLVVPMDIGKNVINQWKFSPDDQPKFRSPKLNDSDWETVHSFPHNWRNPDHQPYSDSKIVWYRIHLRFPLEHKPHPLTLKIGPLNDVDETYFNGELIGKTGVISPSSEGDEHGYDKVRLYHVPSSLIREYETNVIAIRVQSFFPDEGGFRTSEATVTLGYADEVRNDYISGELDAFSFILLFLFFTGLFFFRGVSSRAFTTYFMIALSCACLAVHMFVNSQLKYILSTNYFLYKRVEYVLVCVLIYIIMDFFYLYFLDANKESSNWLYENGKPMVIGLNFVAIVSVVFLAFTNDILMWDWVFMTIFRPLWALPIIVTFWVLISTMMGGNKIARYLLPFYFLSFLGLVNDVLVDLVFISWEAAGHLAALLMIISLVWLEFKFPELALYKNKNLKEPFQKELSPDTKQKIDEAITYANEYFTESLTRDSMAEKHGFSPDYFGKIFKIQTGATFKDYLIELRVKASQKMLEKDDQAIIDIAYSVGFESLRTFNRAFKSITGFTPTAYRKQQNSSPEKN